MTDIDLNYLQQWIGKEEVLTDQISLVKAQQIAGMLDWTSPVQVGDELPAPWHWIYFNPVPVASQTGEDGHPAKGGFMPPVPLPRRMWAGSRVEWIAPVYVGDQVSRVSRILDVQLKQGGAGTLVFVTVQHETFVNDALKIREQQDIVYREPPAPDAPQPPAQSAPCEPQFSKIIQPDPVLLFRYSALTYNSHRIHYDRDYTMQEEGYPALVVQGPLTATLLLDLLREQQLPARLKTFRFRGLRPLFDASDFRVCGALEGDNAVLWAQDADGALAMKMDVTLSE